MMREQEDVYPMDRDSFQAASNNAEGIHPEADHIIVRGQKLKLSYNPNDYAANGITLSEIESREIRWEEAGRLLITQHQNVFRATNPELYKSIPANLDKILVLNEWYHKDFELNVYPSISEF
ncbi:MAG: hypothetical protein HC880_14510 [Bacteroidia bacterium]|nr:hypothetical protein [Bacteroidia bacterium]